MVGSTLSHYRILEKLGEGGMGVVWKALDTRLDREVAIKVLPASFSDDPERVARFEREAKLLASLNHRNIAAIYGVDQTAGDGGPLRFLVMELVEGEDLARKLERGPLPVEESLDICHQLARALEAAHEKGVLHRDLKPANVQVTPEGRVKVLDFGLAKAFEIEGDPGSSPTLTSAGTQVGAILGTAGYMSPEQARGKPLDKRTDIWSFGTILFECLTARPAFRGETISDTLASILKSEANWRLLPDRTPPRVRELLQRCLEKDARNRLRDIGDARLELQRSLAGHESLTDASGIPMSAVSDAVAPKRTLSKPILAAVLVAGVALGVLGWSLATGSRGESEAGFKGIARFSIEISDDQIWQTAKASPDGRTVAYSATPRNPDDSGEVTSAIYLRRFDAVESVLLAGSEGVSDQFSSFAFSPDGRWIVARVPVSPKSTTFRLIKLRVDGSSPPLTLTELPDLWFGPFAWLPNGDILMGQPEPTAMIFVPADGGQQSDPIEIVKEGFEGPAFPGAVPGAVLPGGKQMLGGVTEFGERWDNHVVVVDLESGRTRVVVENGSNAVWFPTGHILFTRGDTLLALPFDPDSLEPTGAQIAVTDGLRTGTIYDAWFDIFPDGTLLHAPGGTVGTDRQVVFIDDSTMDVIETWSDDRRPFEGGVAVSDDGSRVAISLINAEQFYEIWISDMDRPGLTRLVYEPGFDCVPSLWHPDGKRLAYFCSSADTKMAYIRSADGRGEPRKLAETTGFDDGYFVNSFTTDGSTILLAHLMGDDWELTSLSLDEPDAAPVTLLVDAQGGWISPDGRWMLYVSDASGQNDIYLRRFDNGQLGHEIPVTREGCGWAWWHSRPGETPMQVWAIYGKQLYEIDVTPGDRVRVSEPRMVADVSELLEMNAGGIWDLRDGRFLVVRRGDDEEHPRELTVVVNWREELERQLRSER